MEEFRPLIVDGLVLKLLKRHWLRPESFSRSEPGMKLQPEALALFLKGFEERLADTILYEPEGVRLSYAHIIERQVRHFARVLMGEDNAYRSFVVK
jgi:CRISPR-associated protein Cas1